MYSGGMAEAVPWGQDQEDQDLSFVVEMAEGVVALFVLILRIDLGRDLIHRLFVKYRLQENYIAFKNGNIFISTFANLKCRLYHPLLHLQSKLPLYLYWCRLPKQQSNNCWLVNNRDKIAMSLCWTLAFRVMKIALEVTMMFNFYIALQSARLLLLQAPLQACRMLS